MCLRGVRDLFLVIGHPETLAEEHSIPPAYQDGSAEVGVIFLEIFLDGNGFRGLGCLATCKHTGSKEQ